MSPVLDLAAMTAALDDAVVSGPTDRALTDVTGDPRTVIPGALFLATEPGNVILALKRDAAAVISTIARPTALPSTVGWVQVPDVEHIAGGVCAAFFGEPSRQLHVHAVTGTNGKTTVSWLLHHILTRATGHPVGLVGTIRVHTGIRSFAADHTTPPPWLLQRWLHDMVSAGCTHAAMEASSHGLSESRSGHRLVGVRVQVAGFTNLTYDHLDFHGNLEEYFRCKARLFARAESACVNVDDPRGARIAADFPRTVCTVSTQGKAADLVVRRFKCSLSGSRGVVRTPEGDIAFAIPLVGRYNLENAFVAAGMAYLAGVPISTSVQLLAEARSPPGRLERVGGSPCVLVDFAHNPDGLENVLGALRPLCSGRLICVFGAKGNRDRHRPAMGAAVAKRADLAFVTSENPLHEDPNQIIAEVVSGMRADATVVIEPDRRRAIERAITTAGRDDIVLIAGKGHETYQVIGDDKLPFDDRKIASDVLASLSLGEDRGFHG